jgi:imidazolonepropionase-like amidohydrolase
VDYIKIIADIPGTDQPTLNAFVTEFHRHKLLVVAHAASFIPFTIAQDAEADIITLIPLDKSLDSETVARMVTSNRISVPTLTMMEDLTKRPKLSAIINLMHLPTTLLAIVKAKRSSPYSGSQRYGGARDSVKALYGGGVPILAGTDANGEPNMLFDIFHGDSLHHELELLVDAGLSTVDTLRAATSLSAKYFGLSDRGIIEVGKRVDMVLLARDPVQDIRATRSIQRIWCGGIEVKKSEKLHYLQHHKGLNRSPLAWSKVLTML